MPQSGGSKPLWVDGTLLGREEDSPPSPADSPTDDSPADVPLADVQPAEGPPAPSSAPGSDPGRSLNEPLPEEEQQEPKKKTKDAPLLQCHFCQKIMRTDPENIMKNRTSYQIHLVESHFEVTMYGDIPDSESYKCPVPECEFPSTELKSRLRIHLAVNHREFYPRVHKRIRALKMSEKIDAEYQKLKSVIRFFKEDPRVQDDSVPDFEERVKNEKDMPQIKVEISEEFSQFLKTGTVKTEPADSGNKEKGDKSKSADDETGKDVSPEPEKKKRKKEKKAKNKGKKKSKKEIKTKHLRKQQEEVTIKIEDEDDYSSESSKNNDQGKGESDPSKGSKATEIIKLHEDIVNSQDNSPEVVSDERTEEADYSVKTNEESSAEEEIILDDVDDVMEISAGDNAKSSEPDIILDDDEKTKPSENKREDVNSRDGTVEDKGDAVGTTTTTTTLTPTPHSTPEVETDEKDQERNEKPKAPSLKYSCRGCKMEFDKRPDVIIHIITIHMIER